MTFLAIPVDPAVSHSIHAGLEPLRAICPDILWEHPADYHVTLRFLGRCTGAQIANLVLQLGGEAPKVSSVFLQVGELAFFPPRHGRAVLWVGVRTVPQALEDLAQQLDVWAVAKGFTPDKKPFAAHITVARCSAKDYQVLKSKLGVFQCPSPVTWPVTHYALMSRHCDRAFGRFEPVYLKYCAIPLLKIDALGG
jgi:2'-5' RNA ligase